MEPVSITLGAAITAYKLLPEPAKKICGEAAKTCLQKLFGRAYDATVERLEKKDAIGPVFAGFVDRAKNGFHDEAEDWPLLGRILDRFFNNEKASIELRKVISGNLRDVEVGVLHAGFREACDDENSPLPDFDLVSAVLDMADTCRAAAVEEPELREVIGVHTLAAIERSLLPPGTIPIGSAARNAYFRAVIKANETLKFIGIPDMPQKRDICLKEVFVAPELSENTRFHITSKTEEYLSHATPLDEDEEYPQGEAKGKKEVERPSGPPVGAFEVLRSHNRLVILGGPGSGKTTLVRYFALALSAGMYTDIGLDVPHFPILIEIKRLEKYLKSNPSADLWQYMYDQARRDFSVGMPAGFFESVISREPVALMLDGLDEAAGEASRIDIVSMIEGFVNNRLNNDSRVVVTSRPAGYSQARFSTRDFTHFDVLPFDDARIELYIDKWYRLKEFTDGPERAESLKAAVKKSSAVHDLARNPLLLAIIGLIHHGQELPDKRAKLYEKCAETLIYEWDRKKTEDTPDDRDTLIKRFDMNERHRLLELIAFNIQEQAKKSGGDSGLLISTSELKNLLEPYFEKEFGLKPAEARMETNSFITYVRDRTGVLMEQGENLYGFAHKSFQEYFAASYIVNEVYKKLEGLDPLKKCVDSHLDSPNWREVFILAFALLREKDHRVEMIRYLAEEYDPYGAEKYVRFGRTFAVRFLCDFKGAERFTYKEISLCMEHFELLVEFWENFLLENEYLKDILAPSFDELKEETLATQLGNRLLDITGEMYLCGDFDKYKTEPIEALSLFNFFSPEINETLLWIALDDNNDSGIRRSCAESLSKLGELKPAIDVLLKIAMDDNQDAEIRKKCAENLGRIGKNTKEAIAGLLKIAMDDNQDRELRKKCAENLGRIGKDSKEAISGLLKIAMDNNQDRELRTSYAVYVGRIGKDSKEVIAELLKIAVDDEQDGWVRWCCAVSLGELGEVKSAVDILLKIATNNEKSGELRKRCAVSLGQLGEVKSAVDILLKIAMNDESSGKLRRMCVASIGRIGKDSKEAIAGLLKIATNNEKSGELRKRCAVSLGQLGEVKSAVDILLKIAMDDNQDAELRKKCAENLGRIGKNTKEAIAGLLKIAMDDKKDGVLRWRCAVSLGELGELRSAVQVLLKIAMDDKKRDALRWSCAKSLGQLGDVKNAADVFLKMIESEYSKGYTGLLNLFYG